MDSKFENSYNANTKITFDGKAEDVGELLPHLGDEGGDLRLLGQQGYVDVDDFPAAFADHRDDAAQQNRAVDAGEHLLKVFPVVSVINGPLTKSMDQVRRVNLQETLLRACPTQPVTQSAAGGEVSARGLWALG